MAAKLAAMAIGEPLHVTGSPLERGRAQGAADVAEPVVQAISRRLAEQEGPRHRKDVQAYLRRQWAFAEANCGEEFAEMRGVAEGFGLDPRDLFDFLHLGTIRDLAGAGDASQDGCSAWALGQSEVGPAVGKNRDFRGEHAGLQRVFLHTDPAWPAGRKVLCVGSLGAPGVFSSGINSDGLALADTHIATGDHGIGWLRYFLMTRLLARHATVADALADIQGLEHAGGGALVLADAGGAVAAIDLGHRKQMTAAAPATWVARTNHFAPGSVAGAVGPAACSAAGTESEGRLATLQRELVGGRTRLAALCQMMAFHDRDGAAGLCRHAQGGDSRTLSGAVFACRSRLLYFCPGNPCAGGWLRYSVN